MKTSTPTSRSWLNTAELARLMLSGESEAGRKLADQQKAAAQLGVTLFTLRSYLDALGIIESVETIDTSVGVILRSRSVDAVRAIGRWLRFDREGALEFLRQHPEIGSVAVRRAEQAARKTHETPQTNLWDRSLYAARSIRRASGFRGDIINALHSRRTAHQPLLEALLASPWDLQFHAVTVEFERQLGLEGAAYLSDVPAWWSLDAAPLLGELRKLPRYVSDRGVGVVALMRTPGYALPEVLRREAKNLQFRAMLLAERYPIVALPLPDAAARNAFEMGMVEVPVEDEGDEKEAEHRWEWPTPSEKTQPSGRLLLTGRQRGVIVLTTPDTLLADLVGAP